MHDETSAEVGAEPSPGLCAAEAKNKMDKETELPSAVNYIGSIEHKVEPPADRIGNVGTVIRLGVWPSKMGDNAEVGPRPPSGNADPHSHNHYPWKCLRVIVETAR